MPHSLRRSVAVCVCVCVCVCVRACAARACMPCRVCVYRVCSMCNVCEAVSPRPRDDVSLRSLVRCGVCPHSELEKKT